MSGELLTQGIALPAAGIEDLPRLADLHARSRMADLLLAPWTPDQKRAFLDEQFALQHAHFVKVHRKGDFRLVTRGDAPIGRFYFNRSGPEWVLIDILLALEAQAAGLGTALVSWLQRAAADANADRLRLSVAHNNPRAQALYRRLGFEDAGDVAGTHLSMAWRPIRP
ncbi:RimJ/RimL family protein N-acetyltransferase [Sphingomonas kyeonggiensis]|uniref:RimJ/RimL family protein N-acetyltransferase n=1 Tax=Sphingomonas kyeonggiensis TaxID=1268553 RepID=A0A7W7NUA2_9SPHN|nr:GNAT family protein [Sphingomonas kyeonggiensis]MBB4840737.1 RimJ/RimL family protein N-acetyltransferase [Sphingomonas kyeonggiensis]